MTTREKAHKLLDELPESEIEPVLDFIASRGPGAVESGPGAVESGPIADEWGDLDAWSDAASGDALRMLDAEESAAGFSWEDRSRR